MLMQSVFEKWGESIKSFWQNMDYNAFWGWILLVLGIIALFTLIFFTEYKRKERDSVKFTAITLVIAAVFMGFGLHMILVAAGYW